MIAALAMIDKRVINPFSIRLIDFIKFKHHRTILIIVAFFLRQVASVELVESDRYIFLFIYVDGK
jgi:hypothetical protein